MFGKVFSAAKGTLQTVTTAGELCAMCLAVWAFFNPEKTADYIARFESQLDEARASLAAIEANTGALLEPMLDTADNTASIAGDTALIAEQAKTAAALGRGLSVYLYWNLAYEGAPGQLEAGLSISSTSTTPLSNVEVVLLTSEGQEILRRRIASLNGSSTISAEAAFAHANYDPTRRIETTYLCARASIDGGETPFHYQLELEGHIDREGMAIFSVVDIQMDAAPSAICAGKI